MSRWLLHCAVVLVGGGLGTCLLAMLRRDPLRRLVSLQLFAVLVVVVLELLAAWYGRPAYEDVGLVLSLVTFAGTLVYARFLERWL